MPGNTLDHPGSTFGPSYAHFATILGALWDHPGRTLAYVNRNGGLHFCCPLLEVAPDRVPQGLQGHLRIVIFAALF
jgi:hypothetical protein